MDDQKTRPPQEEKAYQHRQEYMAKARCHTCKRRQSPKLKLVAAIIDPDNKPKGHYWRLTGEAFEAEIAKMRIFCRNCADKFYQGRGTKKAPAHGSPGMYQRHKCRCVPCREWKRGYEEERRRKVGHLERLQWHRPSTVDKSDVCVVVAHRDGRWRIRRSDSQRVLSFDEEQWKTFTEAVKTDEFNI